MDSLNINSPWFALAFLVPIIILIIRFAKHKKLSSSMTFPFAHIAKNIKPINTSISSFATKLPIFLRFAALILLVLGLMRFQNVNPVPIAQSNYSGTDIIICLDTSPSMLAIDFNPLDRLTVAKQVVSRFIEGRKSDRIGLVVFSGVAMTLCPLTTDYDALKNLVMGITEKVTQTDGTAIGDALAVSINRLKDSSAKTKIIILVTDGRSNIGEIDPISAAEMATKLGIKIYTVGVAKEGESVIPQQDPYTGRVRYLRILDDLDEETLTKIAEETGALYQRGSSATSLENIFREIDSMEKTDFKAQREYTYTELFNMFLIPALIILLFEILLSNTLCRKIP